MDAKGGDLTGRAFGRLTVLGRAGYDPRGRGSLWRCRCVCGRLTVVRRGNLLAEGKSATRGCGCVWRARGGASGPRSPHAAEYRAWLAARRRPDFPAGWRGDFAAFLAGAGPRPSPRHVLRGGRWVARREARAGRRRGHALELLPGELRTLAEWSVLAGVPAAALRDRLRSGWPPAAALAAPYRPGRRARRPV